MLKIKNITKTYKTGQLVQQALDDVSLDLRDNEFVAVLGPSGSGKTTLLNIIGGLDRYDSGDLIINGRSTKDYKDRDWDTYRNHTVGFVFQSYNLIPHQSILSNVELALTISGISGRERRRRALEALDQVGLKDQAHKKPNQMSGGQMQRVAIARALVNDPDIVLADEPTGALDSKTSLQVMELLKKVADDRLVVMVTHNPELAGQYANRIVNLRDGKIISDSNPFTAIDAESDEKQYSRKARMSYLTALSLSFNNLLTKKGRTILTAFAGSIGIIGIALILALSTGFQNYIDKIQEDTLSSYPLTITSETADASSAILSMVSDRENYKAEGDFVYERQYLTTMFSAIGSNDLKSFKKYLEDNEDRLRNDVQYIRYSYSIKPLIYTIDAADNLSKLNPNSMMSSMYSSSAISFMSSFGSGNNVFSEMSGDLDSYIGQYDVLSGRWPQNFDEMVIVLSEPNSISDLLVYSLGLRDTSELKTIINDVMAKEAVTVKHEPIKFSYDDLMNIDTRLIKATDIYRYNVQYNIYEDMSSDNDYMMRVYERSLPLKIVGIVCAKENNSSMALSPGVAYTKELTHYVMEEAAKTAIVSKQLNDKDIDVFSGKNFNEENEEENKIDFNDMISIDEDALKDAFKINIDEDSFKFQQIDEDKMQEIVLDSAGEAAEAIAEAPDATMLTAVFSSIDAALLNQKIDEYEALEGIVKDGVIFIDDDRIKEIADSLDGESYLDFINILISSQAEYAEYAGMLKMLPPETFDELAKAVASMFEDYYAEIQKAEDYDEKTHSIPYVKNDLVRTYGATLNSVDLLSRVLINNEKHLAIVTELVNGFVNQYTVAIIAGQIGMATAKMMEPMVEAFSSLSDLFKEDLFEFDSDRFAKAFNFDMDEEELSRLMETMMSKAEEKNYKQNLTNLGYQDESDPSSISIYFTDFEGKENFLNFLDSYNEGVDEDSRIRYTDITGLLMNSVKTIVDVVTYVLIAFVSISLVVSSIMIAVITLISVMERTKEIGILRAMGASKRNVSSIFSAETFIIGFLSGTLGVGLTMAAIPLINRIIHQVTDNYDVNAYLDPRAAVILVIIAVVLTIFAGFIPSRKAAKQDPVIALRTE